MDHSSVIRSKEGFTLLEILLAVALLGILAGIVILALNPGKQLADTRNAQRRVDVNTILNAVYQYALDNNGKFPPEITTSAKEICKLTTATSTCGASLISISELTTSEKYLVGIPTDPSGATSTPNGTGYYIMRSANERITVKAFGAEQGQTIEVSR